MPRTELVRDMNAAPVQALRPIPSLNTTVAISGSSQQIALPDAELLRVACTGNCFIQLGVGSAVASSSTIIFPAGVEVFTKGDFTHIAVIQEGAATGNFSVTGLK